MRCELPGACVFLGVCYSNGNTVWVCLVMSVSHFPRWVIHRGDVVTNVICVQLMRRKKVQVVLVL